MTEDQERALVQWRPLIRRLVWDECRRGYPMEFDELESYALEAAVDIIKAHDLERGASLGTCIADFLPKRIRAAKQFSWPKSQRAHQQLLPLEIRPFDDPDETAERLLPTAHNGITLAELDTTFLTACERELLIMYARGQTDASIAQRLGLTRQAVTNRRHRLEQRVKEICDA